MTFETVVGLEVHLELATKSKIFCACAAEFGGAPNTQCCPVCTGMPGTLPVLNEKVVEFALRAGLALGCDITRHMKFDRKNYFYPDLPKSYQISQLYLPICRNGRLDIRTPAGKKRIRLHEIHMEEDAGKLIHDPLAGFTRADYNRCGVPLIEIVTEPDFRSAEEVVAFLEKLKSTLEYLEVSDCKMQEGSMRTDVNLSVRPAGEAAFGARTEMKNMSSFKAVSRAVEYEAKRQIEALAAGGGVAQETRRWDESRNRSFAMRAKENTQDYRYLPDPDLPPIDIDDDWYERVKASLPELADVKSARYRKAFGLPAYDADMLSAQKAMAEFFEEAVRLGAPPKATANWIMGDVFRLLKEKGLAAREMALAPDKLARIIALCGGGALNRHKAREVLAAVFDSNADVDAYVSAHGLLQISGEGPIRDAVAKVLAQNEKSVAEYRDGKAKVFGFLMGQVMRDMAGKADPNVIRKILEGALQP